MTALKEELNGLFHRVAMGHMSSAHELADLLHGLLVRVGLVDSEHEPEPLPVIDPTALPVPSVDPLSIVLLDDEPADPVIHPGTGVVTAFDVESPLQVDTPPASLAEHLAAEPAEETKEPDPVTIPGEPVTESTESVTIAPEDVPDAGHAETPAADEADKAS